MFGVFKVSSKLLSIFINPVLSFFNRNLELFHKSVKFLLDNVHSTYWSMAKNSSYCICFMIDHFPKLMNEYKTVIWNKAIYFLTQYQDQTDEAAANAAICIGALIKSY